MTLFPWQATVQDDDGNAVPRPIVTVRNDFDNSLATIYDIDGNVIDNPIEGETDGFVQFQVERGRYTIEGVKDGLIANIWEWKVGEDASEIKALYESNTDTNAYTDSEKTKLSDIDQGVATTDSPSFAGLTGNAVQQTATDTTSGRLLKIVGSKGSFGLGGLQAPNLADLLATDTPNGFYRSSGGTLTENTESLPPGESDFGQYFSWRYSDTNFQEFYSGITTDDVWHQRYRSASGGRQGWRKFYDTGNIVGTVSVDGSGTPDGAVIERGSNGNGGFTRYADGTQECWHRITLTFANSFLVSAQWTFPAAFLSGTGPVVTATFNGSTMTPSRTELGLTGALGISATARNIVQYLVSGMTAFSDTGQSGSGDTVVMDVKAVGRFN